MCGENRNTQVPPPAFAEGGGFSKTESRYGFAALPGGRITVRSRLRTNRIFQTESFHWAAGYSSGIGTP